MRRRGRVRAAGLAASLLLVGVGLAMAACGAVALPCDVTIAAVPSDTTLNVGDAIPDGVFVVVAPSEVDHADAVIERDDTGQVQVIIRATGDGAARLADYTGSHIGDALAIAINGTVVAVPVVNAPILDGALAISPATASQDDFVKQFAGCVH